MLPENELKRVREELTQMVHEADKIFSVALQVLESGDASLSQEVIKMDTVLDKLEISIDRGCVATLELKKPYAIDFRFIYSAIKINRDLERIGDESKSISKWRMRLGKDPEPSILELARATREVLNTAVQAFLKEDTDLANKVLNLENGIDTMTQNFLENTNDVPQGFIAKSLERVADMATNVAESVIFTTEGLDIRHGGEWSL